MRHPLEESLIFVVVIILIQLRLQHLRLRIQAILILALHLNAQVDGLGLPLLLLRIAIMHFHHLGTRSQQDFLLILPSQLLVRLLLYHRLRAALILVEIGRGNTA